MTVGGIPDAVAVGVVTPAVRDAVRVAVGTAVAPVGVALGVAPAGEKHAPAWQVVVGVQQSAS